MKQKQTDNKTAGIYREIHSVIRYFNLSQKLLEQVQIEHKYSRVG